MIRERYRSLSVPTFRKVAGMTALRGADALIRSLEPSFPLKNSRSR